MSYCDALDPDSQSRESLLHGSSLSAHVDEWIDRSAGEVHVEGWDSLVYVSGADGDRRTRWSLDEADALTRDPERVRAMAVEEAHALLLYHFRRDHWGGIPGVWLDHVAVNGHLKVLLDHLADLTGATRAGHCQLRPR